jgi:hypothetical protein
MKVMVTEKTLGKTTVNAVGCAKGGAYACFASKLVQMALANAPQNGILSIFFFLSACLTVA